MDKSLQGYKIPKYLPFLIIAVFAALSFPFRYYTLPEWGLRVHLILMGIQFFVLCTVWLAVNQINRFFNRILPFEQGVIKRLIIQQLLTLIILVPLLALLFNGVSSMLNLKDNQQLKAVMMLVVILSVVVFNLLVYLVHFIISWQRSVIQNTDLQVKAVSLEKEKLQLQFQQLKNQVNPHFLFNSLSSLDGLIHSNPNLASEFVNYLANIYRYIVEHKDNHQISLAEELSFIKKFISLLSIKYQEGISFDLNISEEIYQKSIITVSLQALIDNAIKHNVVQRSKPLHIEIYNDDTYICVRNNLQVRKQIETSTKQGLEQLKILYSQISPIPVQVLTTNESFTVKLPLL